MRSSVGREVSLMITRKCNMTCAHCSVESSPAVATQPGEAFLFEAVRQVARSGARAIQFTGGEPLLRKELLLRLMHCACDLNLECAVTSNGFWGKSPAQAEKIFGQLRSAGLVRLGLSFDAFHQPFQSAQPLVNIATVAARDDFFVAINIARLQAANVAELSAPFRDLSNVRIGIFEVEKVGAARQFQPDHFGPAQGFCRACASPAITDDGRVLACNGPSYFVSDSSALHLGRLEETSFVELASRHQTDPILETIRCLGPSHLAQVLRTIPGYEQFLPLAGDAGTCHLCHQLTRDPVILAALRQRLSEEEASSLRQAARLVIEHSRQQGSFNPHYVNSVLAARPLLDSPVSPLVLQRSDLQWHRLTERILLSGLEVQAWQRYRHLAQVPASFIQDLAQAAELARQREAQQAIALQAMARQGERAVVWGSSGRIPQRIRVVSERRLLPWFWGLPEAEMLGHSRPMPAPWQPLYALSPEARLVVAAFEFAERGFSNGLQTAWEIRQAALSPDFDWDKVLGWVAQARLPRGFWAALGSLTELFELPIPPHVLRAAPADLKQRRLRWLAASQQARMQPRSPLHQAAVGWLLCDTWSQRLRALLRAGRLTLQAVRSQPPVQLLRLARAGWLTWRRSAGYVTPAPPVFDSPLAALIQGPE